MNSYRFLILVVALVAGGFAIEAEAFYHAQMGRFVNRDPIRYGGGMNMYAYVGGRPCNRVDPFGLDDVTTGGTEFFNVYYECPLREHIGFGWPYDALTPYIDQKIRPAYNEGCIGITSISIEHHNTWTINRGGAPETGSLPNMRRCFKDFNEAQKVQQAMNEAGVCEGECSKGTSSNFVGQTVQARIFAVQYSTANANVPNGNPPQPIPANQNYEHTPPSVNQYNLNSRPIATDIFDPHQLGEGGGNFDFVLFSEPWDPWYDPEHLWVHATEGGANMQVIQSSEIPKPGGAYDQTFFCVECEKRWLDPKPRPVQRPPME